MMMKANGIILLGLTLFTLTACSSREEADAKMARGCEAAAKTMLGKESSDRQIEHVGKKSFDKAGEFRQVTLNVTTKNKEFGYEKDEVFSCKFDESYSPGFTAWKAALVQLKMGDQIYGDEGGQIFGEAEDQMNLTAAVEAAMK